MRLGPPKWALAELVEAGVRSAQPDAAAAALEQLAEMTRASGTDWALGFEASRRALLRDDAAPRRCYREAIERLGRTRVARRARPRAPALRRMAPAGGVAPRRRGRTCGRAEAMLTAWAPTPSPTAPAASSLASGETVRRRIAITPSA